MLRYRIVLRLRQSASLESSLMYLAIPNATKCKVHYVYIDTAIWLSQQSVAAYTTILQYGS